MRIRPLHLVLAAAAAGLSVLPTAPASAGTTHSIAAAPTTLRPNEATTITGTSDCNSSPYTVTLTYTNPDGDPATTTANGTTDAAGEYTQPITVPETAVAGEDASVQSSITSCNGGGAAASNMVALTIDAYEGTLAISPTSGRTGTEVTISGTNCWGDDIAIVFTDSEFDAFVEVEDVTLNEDRTFTGSFTIPDDAGPGEYFFVAECPGTDFEEQPFTVTPTPGAPSPTPNPTPTAPPAPPVVGVVDFTG